MALSEQERNMLEQLEKQFKKDDPEFADAMEAGPARKYSGSRTIIGVLTTLSGISVLLFGASLSDPITGIIVGTLGFAVLIAGGYLATMRSDRTESKFLPRASDPTVKGDETAPEKDRRSLKGSLGEAALWTLFWWV